MQRTEVTFSYIISQADLETNTSKYKPTQNNDLNCFGNVNVRIVKLILLYRLDW